MTAGAWWLRFPRDALGVALAWAVLLAATKPRDLVIVVNPDNQVMTLTPTQVKSFYTGKLTELQGQKMIPINQTLESEPAVAFLKKYIGMTPAEYKDFWLTQQLKSGGVAPMVQKTSVNVRLMVSQLPGGIGYVWSDEVDETVKVVTVAP